MLTRKLATFCVYLFPRAFQRRLRRRIRYALEVAAHMREELRTRDAVLRVYGHPARVLLVKPGSSVESVLFEVQGLAIIVSFNGDSVEHAYITDGDDVFDNETRRQYPWVGSDECRNFAISKGLMKGDKE